MCQKSRPGKCHLTIIMLLVTIVSLSIRYLGKDYMSGDYRSCLSIWYNQIKNAGPGLSALLAYEGDYALPYAFLLWILCKLPVSPLYGIKFISVLFDFLLAVGAAKLIEYLCPSSGRNACIGYCVVLLLPTVFINSAYWGQADAIYSSFCVWAVYELARRRYPVMMIFFGLAFAFKLQSIFCLPFLLLYYWIEKRFSVLQFLIIPGTMILANLPAVLGGYPPLIALQRMFFQVGGRPYMYYYYPNFWFFYQLPTNVYYRFNIGAILLAVCVLLLFVVYLIRKNIPVTQANFLPMLIWTSYSCAFFLPSMHERYGFISEIFAVIWAIKNPRRSTYPFFMILSVLPFYLWALDLTNNPLWLQALSAVMNCCCYFALTITFWKILKNGEDGVANASI